MRAVLRRHEDHHRKPATAFLLDIVIGRVVRDVAVDQPLARKPRQPDHIVPLFGRDIDGILLVLRGCLQRVAVRRHNTEWPAVDVHGVDEAIAATDEAQEQLLPDLLT